MLANLSVGRDLTIPAQARDVEWISNRLETYGRAAIVGKSELVRALAQIVMKQAQADKWRVINCDASKWLKPVLSGGDKPDPAYYVGLWIDVLFELLRNADNVFAKRLGRGTWAVRSMNSFNVGDRIMIKRRSKRPRRANRMNSNFLMS